MADRTDYYRGYDLGIYHVGRPSVRVLIFEKRGLPPIPAGATGKTIEAALQEARRLIDARLGAHPN